MTKEIQKQTEIDAPAEAVFQALTDGRQLARWFSNRGASLDHRVGGAVEFKFLRPDGEMHTVTGKVIELVPGRKLSYSWNGAGESGGEVVSWSLEPLTAGRTRVTITHAGVNQQKEDSNGAWSYEAGWNFFLAQLATFLKQ